MLRPPLCDLPVLESVDDNTGHLYTLSRRRDTEKLARMHTGRCHPDHYEVSLGDQFVNDGVALRRGEGKGPERLFDRFKPRPKTGDRRWIVVDKIGRKKLIHRREFEPFSIEPTHQTLVILQRHPPPPIDPVCAEH